MPHSWRTSGTPSSIESIVDEELDLAGDDRDAAGKKYGTVREFCEAHPEHMLTVATGRVQNKRVPVWCGACQRYIEGNPTGRDDGKYCNQHVTNTKAHVKITLDLAKHKTTLPILVGDAAFSPLPIVGDPASSLASSPDSKVYSDGQCMERMLEACWTVLKII